MKKVLFIIIFSMTVSIVSAQNANTDTESDKSYVKVKPPVNTNFEYSVYRTTETAVKLLPGLGYKICIPAAIAFKDEVMISAVAPNASTVGCLTSFSIDVANAKMLNALRIPSGYRLSIYVSSRGGGFLFTSYDFVPVEKY